MGYTAIGDCRDPACNFLRRPVALQLPCVGTMTTTLPLVPVSVVIALE